MGCAFDLDLINKFGEDWHGYDVVNHLKRLNIQNINWEDEERWQQFCYALGCDYRDRKANFLSYAREGMDARVLWELRKSAILWEFMEGDKDPWFFEAHEEGWDKWDVKAYRSSVLSTKFQDYEDHDWQYFWVLDVGYGRDYAYEYFDPEMCFADGDPCKVDDLGDPPRDLAWRIIPISTYEPKCRQGAPEKVPMDLNASNEMINWFVRGW